MQQLIEIKCGVFRFDQTRGAYRMHIILEYAIGWLGGRGEGISHPPHRECRPEELVVGPGTDGVER